MTEEATRFTTGLRSSLRGDWKTPKTLYAELIAHRFDVSERHGGGFDALTMDWPAPWFCNPPYGREIARWVSRMPGAGPGVALLPARTDTAWYHDHIWDAVAKPERPRPWVSEIQFIRGRLHFDGMGPAPFPSMLVYFNGETPSLLPSAVLISSRVKCE